MEVTALFENVDLAECALVRLHGLGVRPTHYRMRPAQARDRDTPGAGYMMAMGAPYVTAATSLFGPPAYGAGDVWAAGAAMSARQDEERYSVPPEAAGREVVLQLTVPDGQEKAARSALISNHGRRVRSIPQ